jgi:hypothetical protein
MQYITIITMICGQPTIDGTLCQTSTIAAINTADVHALTTAQLPRERRRACRSP